MNKSAEFLIWLLLFVNLCESSIVQSEKAERQKYVKLYQCSRSSSDKLIHMNIEDTFSIPHHLMTTNQSTNFGIQRKCSLRHPNCHAEYICTTQSFNTSLRLNSSGTDFIDGLFTRRGLFRISNEYFNRNEFCINGLNSTHIDVSICKPDCGKTKLCIPKCCSIEKALNLESKSCVYTQDSEYWKPLVYQSEDVQICGEKKTNLRLHYTQHIPICEKYIKYTLKTYTKEEHRVRFRFLRDGKVILKELQSKEWHALKEGEFCLDGIQTLENGKPKPLSRTDQLLIGCFPDYMEDSNMTVSSETSKLTFTGVLYIFLLFSGTPFLLITVIVYILLWEKQNCHGWTLFSHNLAMLLNYFCQGLTNTVTRIYNSEDNRSASCILIGVACHFFVMASFCWLTMINLDLWLTFRHLQNTVGQSKGVKRFLLYTLFGWGLPLLAITIGLSLDSKYGLHGDDADCEAEVVAPLYGHRSCYIVEEARSYYLYYPIAGLMVINLWFASVTMYHMYQHTQSTKATLLDSSSKHRQSFKVLAKLFVVMGLVWMLEIVVWRLRTKDDTLPWYLIFPDVLNLFQAIAIFILFTCKSKVIDQLCDLYPKLRPYLKQVKLWPCYTRKEKPDTSVKLSVVCDSSQNKISNDRSLPRS